MPAGGNILAGTDTSDSILSNPEKLHEYLLEQNLLQEADQGKKNLIVNYLPVSFRECHLAHLFCEVGELVSVRIIVDKKTKRSKGYGFVKFTTAESASKAIQLLNGKDILGKTLKVAYARPGGPRARANLFVGNVPKYWDDNDLEGLFEGYAPIIECKILRNQDKNRESKRCGFVRLDTEQAANRAIKELDGFIPKGQYHGIHVKIAEKPDRRRDHQEPYMPRDFPEMSDHHNSFLNGPSRHLGATASENHKFDRHPSDKRDPTRNLKKKLGKSHQARSLPLIDDELADDLYDKFQEAERQRLELMDDDSMNNDLMRKISRTSQTSDREVGSPVASPPVDYNHHYAMNQQNPIIMNIVPQMQTYALQPVNQYDLPPSPATTPPPTYIPYGVTTPPHQMFAPDMSDPLPLVNPDPPKVKTSPLKNKKKKLSASSKKKMFQKFKKTESEMELEEIGIDVDDLPPSLPTIKEQGSFQVSITRHNRDEYEEDSDMVGEPPLQNDSIGSADGDVQLPTVMEPDMSGVDAAQMEQIVQQDMKLINNDSLTHDSLTQDAFLAVTPPMTGGIPIVASTPPPRFSSSPIMVPITPPLQGMPGGSMPGLPISVPMASTPVQITTPGYQVSPNNLGYSSDTMTAEAGLSTQHTPNPLAPEFVPQQDWSGNTNNDYITEKQDSFVLPPAQQVGENVRHGTHVCLFVYNLPPFFSEAHLYNLFAEYGPVKYTTVHRHKDGTSKGFGFVNYYTSESARRAIKNLNGNIFYNKKLQVRYKV